MIRLRPSQADEVLIKRVQDWYEPGPGAFITNQYGFSPAVLFQYGEQGAWYDPSDLTTLYQDSAGTTPVTAVEQPVGLMLDKSKGLVLGPELVTNGNFSQGTTGWTLGSGWSVSGGRANIDGTNAGSSLLTLTAGVAATAGKIYKVSFTYSSTTGRLRFNPAVGNSTALMTSGTSGTFTAYLTAVDGTCVIQAPDANTVAWVDNISVRELPGNHAFQTTSANRPVLSARVNLLTKTEDFSDAVWQKILGVTVTANTTVAPNGTTTADTISFPNTSNGERIDYDTGISAASAGSYTGAIYLKGSGTIRLSVTSSTGVGPSVETPITLTSSWVRYEVSNTFTGASTGTIVYRLIRRTGDTATSSLIAWGADLRVTNTGVNLPPYQRVNTSTDYDTTGFPLYLKANGTNSAMQTNSIDFSGTDKMTVWAGVRKLSDAAISAVAELSATSTSNAGTFFLSAPRTPTTGDYGFRSNGTALVDVLAPASYSAPITNVLTGVSAISTPVATLRVNGTQAATSSASQGTGNYGNYPLYLFARAGTSLFFNGNFYGLIVRGAQSTAAQISSAEQWINSKTKAY